MRLLIEFLLKRGPGQLRRSIDQRDEKVRLVIGNFSLQYRRQPFQPRSRINRRLGQRIELARRVPIELHEHQVPNFDVPTAIAAESAVGVSLVRRDRAHVIVNLAAWPAGTGVANLPEVILGTELEIPLLPDTLPEPQVVGLLVARHAAFTLEDGHEELVFRNAEPLG